ncbi:MAG: hypothetical protein WC998_09880 [Candidatus Paceibacterota bacterium]
MSKPIRFCAQVSKVQTMSDMGLRVILDFSEADIMQAAMLMECKKMGVILDIEATPRKMMIDDDSADGKKGRHEIKSMRGS